MRRLGVTRNDRAEIIDLIGVNSSNCSLISRRLEPEQTCRKIAGILSGQCGKA